MTNKEPIDLLIAFLWERANSCDANMVTDTPGTNTVIAVGDVHSGLAIYNPTSKLFKFYYTSSTDLIFRSDDALYEQTNSVEQFCELVCQKK